MWSKRNIIEYRNDSNERKSERYPIHAIARMSRLSGFALSQELSQRLNYRTLFTLKGWLPVRTSKVIVLYPIIFD